MARRRKLPPGYPTQPYVRPRGPKHECTHCGGTTRAVKGQSIEEAVAIHEQSCPGLFHVNPKQRKDKT